MIFKLIPTIVMAVLLVGCVEKSSNDKSRSVLPQRQSYGGKPKHSADSTASFQRQTPQPGDQNPVRQPKSESHQPNGAHSVSPTPVTPPTFSPPVSNVRPIHLSAGAALPQSLPQGTTMTFTANYQVRGSLKSGVRYVAVITDRRGRAIKAPLPGLRSRGQLPALFTRQFRPGDAPFQAFIEEHPLSTNTDLRKPGKRVSNVVPLR